MFYNLKVLYLKLCIPALVAIFLFLIASCFSPTIKVDTTQLGDGNIANILENDWMNAGDDISKKIKESFIYYINKNKCNDYKCYVNFGFDKCDDGKDIRCYFHRSIVIEQDRRSNITNKRQEINININMFIPRDKKDIKVDVNRSGGSLFFH